MTIIFLVIHVILAITLVVVVLLQRSDGGALGGLGGGASFGGVMSGRQSANFLTRTTAVLAAAFIGTSLILAILATRESDTTSVIDQVAPLEEPAPPPALPSLTDDPGEPAVPLTDE